MREMFYILTGTFDNGRGGVFSHTITGGVDVNGHPRRVDIFNRLSDQFKAQFRCDGFVVTYFYLEESKV